ncbi:hypothetical protein ACTFIW_002790 [Dictyostelium discoideum]
MTTNARNVSSERDIAMVFKNHETAVVERNVCSEAPIILVGLHRDQRGNYQLSDQTISFLQRTFLLSSSPPIQVYLNGSDILSEILASEDHQFTIKRLNSFENGPVNIIIDGNNLTLAPVIYDETSRVIYLQLGSTSFHDYNDVKIEKIQLSLSPSPFDDDERNSKSSKLSGGVQLQVLQLVVLSLVLVLSLVVSLISN